MATNNESYTLIFEEPITHHLRLRSGDFVVDVPSGAKDITIPKESLSGPGRSEQAKLSLAAEVKETVLGLLNKYEISNGFGPDAYCDTPGYHPMADGKYLSTVACLYQAGVISASNFNKYVNAACNRLLQASLPFGEGLCWGLNFSWRDAPDNEPYLITSSIVCSGLFDCCSQGIENQEVLSLLQSSLIGLKSWQSLLSLPVFSDESIFLPAFSPSINEPIYNAAAYALAMLHKDTKEDNEAENKSLLPALHWLKERYIENLGWCYSPNSEVIDLLHQCYILNALGVFLALLLLKKK